MKVDKALAREAIRVCRQLLRWDDAYKRYDATSGAEVKKLTEMMDEYRLLVQPPTPKRTVVVVKKKRVVDLRRKHGESPTDKHRRQGERRWPKG